MLMGRRFSRRASHDELYFRLCRAALLLFERSDDISRSGDDGRRSRASPFGHASQAHDMKAASAARRRRIVDADGRRASPLFPILHVGREADAEMMPLSFSAAIAFFTHAHFTST